MTTSIRIHIALPPASSNNLEKIDYAKMFSKRIPGTLCRVQIGICSLLCLTELVWLIINTDNIYGFPNSEIGSTAAGIWCGLFGLMPAGLGLWIWKKPSRCTIIAFMALSTASAYLCIPFLTLAVFKANLADRYPRPHFSLLMTMSVIQIILGVLQAVATVACIVLPAKQLVALKRTIYYATSTTVNENGDEVIQLEPMKRGNGTALFNQITLYSTTEPKLKEQLMKTAERS